MSLRYAFLCLTATAAAFSAYACGATDTNLGSAAAALTGQPCNKPGATAPAKDGCNTCTCTGGTWSCTEIVCVADPGGGNTSVGCTYDGKQYKAGDGFPSSDGCNSCGCQEDGTVACTLKACLPGNGGSGGGSSGTGGGSSVDPVPPSDPFPRPQCTYNGKTYQAGESFPSADGCNTCSCAGGDVACTEKACLCPAPVEPPPDTACPAAIVYAKDPASGACCQYGSSCSAPREWKHFFTQEECVGASACPAPSTSQEICNQVIVWAKDPSSGACCQYGTPCDAPEGWPQFVNEGECQSLIK